MPEKINKKTTCNKKIISAVLPAPTAALTAEIVGISESYVKKIRMEDSQYDNETAEIVKFCDELIVDGQKVLVQAVSEKINQIKSNNDEKGN